MIARDYIMIGGPAHGQRGSFDRTPVTVVQNNLSGIRSLFRNPDAELDNEVCIIKHAYHPAKLWITLSTGRRLFVHILKYEGMSIEEAELEYMMLVLGTLPEVEVIGSELP